jgi:hypothetical protein
MSCVQVKEAMAPNQAGKILQSSLNTLKLPANHVKPASFSANGQNLVANVDAIPHAADH